MALMLGVHVAWVSPRRRAPAEAQRLIHHSRGNITVLDRTGLRAASCVLATAADRRSLQIRSSASRRSSVDDAHTTSTAPVSIREGGLNPVREIRIAARITRREMVRLKFRIDLKYEIADHPSDFIFNVTPRRRDASRWLRRISGEPAGRRFMFTDPAHGSRYARLRATRQPGGATAIAMVDIAHHIASPDSVEEVPIAQLPAEALAYIYPSRYCQSDRLHQFARAEFGGSRPAIAAFGRFRTGCIAAPDSCQGGSNADASAVDTLIEQVGVCRSFAHLMIALCRALNIPARFATGIDYGSDPAFGPTDFHAYVEETFLGGRWYLFDPSGMALPMGLIRLGTGRDAADVFFRHDFRRRQCQSAGDRHRRNRSTAVGSICRPPASMRCPPMAGRRRSIQGCRCAKWPRSTGSTQGIDSGTGGHEG